MFESWNLLLKKNWDEARRQKNFVLWYALNTAACLAAYLYLAQILIDNRHTPGVILADPIFKHFKPIDFSVPVFVLMYASIFSFIIYIIPRPKVFMYATRAFVVLFALRLTFIFLVPLAPPTDVICLKDPFTDNVIGFKSEVMNDLMFSGHVADLCFFIFCCLDRRLKAFITTCTVLIAIMLLWQKIHYTADVIAAPFFAYGCYVVMVKKYNTPANNGTAQAVDFK